MAEINKLSVGEALDKLRGAETTKSRMTQFDDKIAALGEDMERMRSARTSIERSQRGVSPAPNKSTPQKKEASVAGVITSKVFWMTFAIVIAVAALVWASRLL